MCCLIWKVGCAICTREFCNRFWTILIWPFNEFCFIDLPQVISYILFEHLTKFSQNRLNRSDKLIFTDHRFYFKFQTLITFNRKIDLHQIIPCVLFKHLVRIFKNYSIPIQPWNFDRCWSNHFETLSLLSSLSFCLITNEWNHSFS